MRVKKQNTKRTPRRVVAPKLSSGFRLIIGNTEIDNMGPAAKISLIKSRLAATARRAVSK